MSAVVKPRQKAGSWSTFERRYKPVESPDSGPMRPWNCPKLQGVDESLIWTVVDCDGKCYVVPGYHTVNYIGRILCQIAWGDVEEANPGYVY